MNELFVKYRKKLTAEGVLKSVLTSALFGLAAMFVTAGIFWILGNKELVWLPPVVMGGVTFVLFWLFYYVKYRPTETTIARRLDALGLEERMITMAELQGDDSYIAQRQRADAREALGKVQADQLKFRMRKGFVIALSIVGALSVAMWAVQILMKVGVIGSLGEQLAPPPVEYLVEYDVEGDGIIDGELVQQLYEGDLASEVMAEAMEGWVFVGWSDGMSDPIRDDSNIIETMKKDGVTEVKLIAVFQELADEVSGDPVPGEGEGQGDAGQGQPGVPGEGQPGEGEPSDKEGDQGQESDSPGDGEGDGAGGAPGGPESMVNDGNTKYGDNYEDGLKNAQDEVSSGDYTNDQKDAIDDYYNNMKP